MPASILRRVPLMDGEFHAAEIPKRSDAMPSSEPPSIEKRLDILERDVRSHARTITGFVDADKTFSPAQLAQLRSLMGESLGNVGLRIDDPNQVDEARRDFQFVRNLRNTVNGTASKIGWFIIAAILAGFVWLMQAGLTFWKGH
jgi:hypothetical protein